MFGGEGKAQSTHGRHDARARVRAARAEGGSPTALLTVGRALACRPRAARFGMVGWLDGWLVGWLVVLVGGWLVGCLDVGLVVVVVGNGGGGDVCG